MEISLPQGIKGLIFDLDGTLADTMPVHIAAWKVAANSFGVTITDQMIQDRSGMPTVKVAELLNKDYGWTLDPVQVKQAKDLAYKELKPMIGVKPIEPIYKIAKDHRGVLPMAIGTGSTRRNAENTLITLDIMQWFDVVITADEVAKHKPNPETYLKCAEGIGIEPADCVVFEDAEFGIQAAQAAGMKVIDVRNYAN